MVIWQDLVLTAGTLSFAIALLPSIFGKDKPNMFTSILTGAWLYVFSWTYFSLQLSLSAIVAVALAVEWTVLAFQVAMKKRGETLRT